MKVLIINGSHRAGNTDTITSKIKDRLSEQKHEVRELLLRDIEMKLPDGCPDCAESEECPNIKDEFSSEIEPTIRDYDLYIIATPTWSDNITPLTKIFWDRIVTWCNEENMYLKDKKLALITHGMAGDDSWSNVINWVKSVCSWEECNYVGSLTGKSTGEINTSEITDDDINAFINKLLS